MRPGTRPMEELRGAPTASEGEIMSVVDREEPVRERHVPVGQSGPLRSPNSPAPGASDRVIPQRLGRAALLGRVHGTSLGARAARGTVAYLWLLIRASGWLVVLSGGIVILSALAACMAIGASMLLLAVLFLSAWFWPLPLLLLLLGLPWLSARVYDPPRPSSRTGERERHR